MTLIIQAPGVITHPIPGSIVPPDLGVSGVLMRHVPASDYAIGASVGTVSDLAGNRPLELAAGSVTMAEVSGMLAASLAAGGQLTAGSQAYPNGRQRSHALLVHIGAIPAATTQFAGTILAGGGMQATMAMVGGSGGRIGAYGDGTPYPQSAAIGVGWHRVVAAYGDGEGAICVDGVITRGPQTFAASGSNLFASIRSSAALPISFVDHVVFDHGLSDAEIALVDAALASWLA